MTEQPTRTPLSELSAAELSAFVDRQRAAYEALKDQDLKLDLTRGKPSTAQLDLSDALISLPTGAKDADGVDVRNYGGLAGLREIREMFADLLWVEPDQVVAGDPSVLTCSALRRSYRDLLREGRPDDKPLLDIYANLYVERDSQKGIMIGHKGARLREVGTAARKQIEALLGTPVYLDLHIKIAKDWQRDPRQLRKLGF